MKLLTLEVPGSIEITNAEAKMIFAAKLYEMGKVSLGQGASIAGLPKRGFIENLGNYGVSVFNYSVEDLEMEFNNAALHCNF